MTEVWFRNPYLYIRECVELMETHIVWDRGYAIKKQVDALRHADLHYPQNTDLRILMVGQQGTAELRRGSPMSRPAAVYPTWVYGRDTLDDLEEWLANPAGESRKACSQRDLPADELPVYGQEHRIVATLLPMANDRHGQRILRVLAELQEEHPEAILHIHGLYSYRYAFGLGYRSVDIEPRTTAQKGKVYLPNGKEMTYERARQHPNWVRAVGFAPSDLEIPRKRCMFNMRSAQWAAQHYRETFKFHVGTMRVVDYEVPDVRFVPPRTTRTIMRPTRASLGDRFLCDRCSLQDECKSYRHGGVCVIAGSEASKLAEMFGSRDSDQIIDGLGALMAKQAERVEKAIEDEEATGILNPEVTKMLNSAFVNAVKLAKLINPNLNGGTKVNIAVGAGGAAAISAGTPQQLTSEVVRMLEAQGVPRDKITPDLVRGLLALPAGGGDAIDVDSP